MPEGKILVARESAMFDWDGQQVFIHQGRTTAREGHPVLRGREHLFEPLVPVFEAEPAQERAGRKPAGRTA